MPKQILVVDDSVTIQRVVELTFQHEADYKVVRAKSVDEGLQKARDLHPDIVLADASLQGKTGYDLCAALRADGALSQVACLIMAGNFAPYDQARGEKAGADGVVVKPFESQALIDKVADVLGKRGGRAATPAKKDAGVEISIESEPAHGASSESVTLPQVSFAPPVPAPPKPAPPPAHPVAASPPKSAPSNARTIMGLPSPVSVPPPKPAEPPSRPTPAQMPAHPHPASHATMPQSVPQMPRPSLIPNVQMPAAAAARPAPAPAGAKPTPRATLMGIPSVNPANLPPGVVPLPPPSPKPAAAWAPPVPGATAPAMPAGARPAEGIVSAVADRAVAEIAARGGDYEAVAKLSREVIERIAWEVVPELAETIIREQLDRLVAERNK